MKGSSTTTRRSSGIRGRIALGAAGLALGGLAVSAAGQGFAPYPPMKWRAQESLNSHQDAHDEGVDIVYWKENGTPDRHWIYVTGWVTEMDDGQVKGTRFATYRYDAAAEGSEGTLLPDKTAYFPPLGTTLQEGDTYKAVAMVFDEFNGRLFITGAGPS